MHGSKVTIMFFLGKKNHSILFLYIVVIVYVNLTSNAVVFKRIMHLSMLSPRGEGGGPRAYVGHLTSIAFPNLGNLTKNLGPRMGTFAFFLRRGMEPSHSLPCARLCAGHIDGQTIESVACDSCPEWHHIACVEIESISKWTCTSCK